jgi:eukaryotic-like serine/threonine-protein kinase
MASPRTVHFDGAISQPMADDLSQTELAANEAAAAPLKTSPPSSPTAQESTAEMPVAFGRYRVERTLGEGGFGVVYRGHDPDLCRAVAIKVPRRDRITSAASVEAFLSEARLLAKLNHPGIVPVYDFGRTDDGLCYVVSQFVAGGDLAALIARKRLSPDETAGLLARIAEALHHTHQHGLVHRDVKPANILLDEKGHPLVGDFGLALTDESYGRQAGAFGTPAYMSPEQARGEGHRDARSDIYSLGIVFYELLTGRRPYRRSQFAELIEEISSGETRPPRQLDHTIPAELERICLKAMAKRLSDRYTTAFDFAADLRHYADYRKQQSALHGEDDSLGNTLRHVPSAEAVPEPLGHRSPHAPREVNHHAERDAYGGRLARVKVIPKGLRSFDAHDADFFLQLLPGPTDRDGLPESIRFWKTRIEMFDLEQTFTVGLLYGPSGCGKSSLVKAGLLPRLSPQINTIFLEATSDDTEARLYRALSKLAQPDDDTAREAAKARRDEPDFLRALAASREPGTNLTEVIAQLRRSDAHEKTDAIRSAPATKVLIVLDQFEQWLHAHPDPQASELARALRQCDGAHVQCLVMVRDDFWLAASRFMQALEVPLLEGVNSALVDLFDTLHARHVLALFGRAYGRLPDDCGAGVSPAVDEQAGRLHHNFLDAAVSELAENGKVVSVRLALFAEMVKGKSWTPATLKQIGGISGVGVTFLDETFSASTAPPRHRFHQQAARAVLKALLPDAGTEIKGHRRSRDELLAASGYARRPADFAELLRILDNELRLVTPADEDAEGRSDGEKERQGHRAECPIGPSAGPSHEPEAPARNTQTARPDGLGRPSSPAPSP